MLSNELILSGLVGIIASAVSAFVTWVFSRRKYRSEVDHNNIENMENSLEFYEKLSSSNNKILEDILARSEKLAESNLHLLVEVQNLRAQVDILVRVIQTELSGIDLSKYGIKVDTDGTITRA